MPEFHIAQVMSVDDKDANNQEQKKGRVQIYVPFLHNAINDNDSDKLPWAQSASPFTSWIPQKDDLVWVFFEKEKYYKNPYYLFPVNLFDKNEHDKTLGSLEGEYPDLRYIKCPNDVCLTFNANKDEPEISLYHPKFELYVDADGHGKIYFSDSENKIDFSDDGIAVEDKNGNKVTMDSDGMITEDTNGNKITMSSSGIKMEDANNNVIEMGSSSIKFNNTALEVSQ